MKLLSVKDLFYSYASIVIKWSLNYKISIIQNAGYIPINNERWKQRIRCTFGFRKIYFKGSLSLSTILKTCDKYIWISYSVSFDSKLFCTPCVNLSLLFSFYLYNTQVVLHYLLYTKYLCVGVSTTVWVWTYAHVHKNYLNNETEEKSDIQNSSIEWEDQAFKHGNGKSTRETSSTQLLLLFYLSFYSEVLFSPCVSFSRLISVYFELLMLLRRLMTLLSHLLVFYY